MTVNPNNEVEGEAFMKLVVALEVANQEMMAEIQQRMAKVVAAFKVYLRELLQRDLEGSADLDRSREAWLRRVKVGAPS
ncbi:hypothetical protein VW29_17960, partial [Devosia limi DSM 17137]